MNSVILTLLGVLGTGALFILVINQMLKRAKETGKLEASGEQARQMNEERERVSKKVKEIEEAYEDKKHDIPDNWDDVERMRKEGPIKLPTN